MLGKRRRVRRWIPVVVGLALVVTVGTFYFMIQQGQAMARRDMVLDCAVPVHQHSEACFDGEEKLACGYANYVVHEHNDNCYDKEAALVCALPEIREHHHVEACYEKREVMICGQEQTVGHVHLDGCYEEALTCQLEESPAHAHGAACYDENQELVCGLEEGVGHSHGPDCSEKELVCGQEAGAGSHIHTDDCKETELILTCGKPEISLHAHTKECYSVLGEDGTLSKVESLPEGGETDQVLVLTCGMLQTEKHEHGNECFRKPEQEESTVESLPESGGEQSSALEESAASSSALESSGLASSDVESSGLESGEDTPSSQPEEAEPQPDKAPQEETAYEDATLKVKVEGELPEGTHLVVERLEDPQQLAQRQAKLKQAMGDEEYALHALLQVGLRDENGEQVPFDGPVSLKAEFFGEGVSAEGGKVCAVAFAEAPEDDTLETVPGMVLDRERAQQLPVTLGEGGGAVTQIEEETLLGFGSKAPVKVDADQVNGVQEQEDEDANVLHVSQSFSYDTDSLFNLMFHVEGDATLPEQAEPESPEEPEVSSQADPALKWGEEETESQAADTKDEGDPLPSAAESPEEPIQEESSASQLADETVSQPETDSQPAEAAPKLRLGGAIVATGGILPANSVLYLEQPVEFVVEKVQAGEPAYLPYADYVQAGKDESESQEETGLSPLEVMSYKLRYGGQELDISACRVTVEVRSTQELEEQIKALTPEDVASEAEGDVGVILSMLAPAGNGEEAVGEKVIYPSAEAVAAAKAEEDIQNAPRMVEEQRLAVSEESDICMLDSREVTQDSEEVIMNMVVHKQGVPMPTTAEEPENANRAVSRNTIALTTNTSVNPHYAVEYYAYLDRVDRMSSGLVTVIDTSGEANGGSAKLPQNGVPTQTTSLNVVDENGNVVEKTQTGKVKSTEKLTEIYKAKGKTDEPDDVCTYFTKPNIHYIDALVDPVTGKKSDSYILKQIWVLKDDAKDITDEEERSKPKYWDIYGESCRDIVPSEDKLVTNCENKLHFTNRRDAAGQYGEDVYIHIAHESILRLVYEPTAGPETVGGTFYDYDISSGPATANELDTQKQGINAEENYKGKGAKYAFGNAETTVKTGRGDEMWGAESLNRANSRNVSNCTFGIVTGITNGVPVFADGINVPDLFSGTEFKGKHVYADGNLTFNRVGDTYTMSSATVNGSTLSGLDSLTYAGPNWNGTKHRFTNEFWPMDSITNLDGNFGGDRKPAIKNGNMVMPASDNGIDHNAYFGLHSTIHFDLTANYAGPLEYLFFGDDDMWVFLTDPDGNSRLICDIGGVHISVGEYVDLWNYIEQGQSGGYKLDFYYTERGASGSTCWMQFTLPSVHGGTTTVEEAYTQLKIEKKVEGLTVGGNLSSGGFDISQLPSHDEEFIFNLKLTTADGGRLPDDYSYAKYNADGQPVVDGGGILDKDMVLHSGADFTLKNGEYIIINMLPDGTKYTVTENREKVSGGLEEVKDDNGNVTGYKIKEKDPDNDYLCSAYITQHNKEIGQMVQGEPTDFGRDTDRTMSGQVHLGETDDKIQVVTYVNTIYAYELPKTGGGGIQGYIWAGAALLSAAGLALVYKTSRRRGKEGVQKS